MKTALITGITGQDGSYLADLLLAKGYTVHGIIRRASTFNTARIAHIYQDPHETDRRLHLHYGELTDGGRLEKLVASIEPDEVYNLGAQSHVKVSFDEPIFTSDVDGLGALRMLEAIRQIGAEQHIRFYQASTSEMFGRPLESPQSETTPMRPDSPYACAKLFAFHQVRLYREAYGMHASNGILFNHESPRRGETFVTRKITRGLARILAGLEDKIFLGNLEAKRDWGHARDFVEAMWLMLQQDEADDYVIATGETRSISDFLAEAFALVDRDWREYVEIDERYFRPIDIDELLGDATKARRQLEWTPKISFSDMVREMLIADMELLNLNPSNFNLVKAAYENP
ncbi:MAG: GDP-mannose 4,6-dehydratase [Rhodospirillaceae bacterium]|jgi:GDPmannose 4,6-dehydratase|nr:GDP-mannose 4,6-dehydratase [Rhodospirillaceae bacterium]